MQPNLNSSNTPKSSAERFTSTGFILAAIGSAVGLGNMWKFPYITGKYGGAAFFLVFIVCLILVGLPILLAEMSVGRGGRSNAVTSFHNLSKSKIWGRLGFLTVLAPFAILSFYVMIAGWTMHYAFLAITGNLFSSSDYGTTFGNFAGSYMPIFWQIIALALTAWVVIKGISGGIEKFNKVLIPGFVVILLVLVVRSLTLPGAGEGVEFFLKPDFSKLTAESLLVALGHAFFSLSLGMGIMATYGSYVDKRQSLGKASLAIAGGDLLYALLAGLIIFPTAFAYGIDAGQGPGLVFVALPAAFAAMPLGNFFGFLFFGLLAVAAFTSTVSLLEVPVAYVMDKFKTTRKKATIWTTVALFIVGVPSILSMGPWADYKLADRTYFDWFDFVASNLMLPLGGLIVTLFTAYAWKTAGEEAGLTGFWYNAWMFLLRYVAPILVIAIFLFSLGVIKF